jgi:O-antigen ligase
MTGLATAIFTLAATMLSATQSVYQKRFGGVPSRAVVIYMAMILVLCRSTGAIIFGLVFLSAFLFMKPKRCFALTSILALLFCVYPTVRILNWFPDDALDQYMATASPDVRDRLESMQFRFMNERSLTERARERLWFGWGGSSRGDIYDEDGRNITVIDGAWIGALSTQGVSGLTLFYAVMILPLLYAGKWAKRLRRKDNIAILSGFCFVLLGYLLDQLPNGLFNFAPIFFAGVVWQFGKVAIEEEKRAEAMPTEAPLPPPDWVQPVPSRKVIIVR